MVSDLANCENAQANALLIAALPDLLDALKEIDNLLVDECAGEIASKGFDTLRSYLDAGLTEEDYRQGYAIFLIMVLRKKFERIAYPAIQKAEGEV